MSKRRILALLVVLALSLSIAAVPAGSATLQRTEVAGESVTGGPVLKDGDGEDIDGGDDDRWGNTGVISGGDDEAGQPDDDGDDESANHLHRVQGHGVLRIELGVFFDLLAILL